MARRARQVIVWLIVLLPALALRFYWLSIGNVVSNDGTEYARIAENLVAGNGYTGLIPGPELTFPPLYPLLTALCMPVAGSAESAGRAVSMVMGALLLLPLGAVVGRLFGRRIAFVAAALAAIHPLFVGFSAEVFSEATFVATYLGALYFAILSMDRTDLKLRLSAGVLFGLSYLTRPEALLHLVVVVVFLLIHDLRRKEGRRKAASGIGAMIISFAIFAVPYIAFLTSHTDRLTLEGKTVIHCAVNQRIKDGLPDGEARWGIGENLEEEGPLLDPGRYLERHAYGMAPDCAARYVLDVVRRNAYAWLYLGFWDPELTLPFLGIMMIIGLAFGPREGRRFGIELALLVMTVLFTLAALVSSGVTARFLFPSLPLVLVWASRGIDLTGGWLRGAVRRLIPGRPARDTLAYGRVSGALPVVLIFGCFVLFAAAGLIHQRSSYMTEPGRAALKEAGLWLGDFDPADKTVMSVRTTVPYYSGAVWMPSPCAREDAALGYVRAKAPDYVVLSAVSAEACPYIERWLREGIPDETFSSVYARGESPRDAVRIYRYVPSPAVSP